MTLSAPASIDAAGLAAAVRQLALQAHRVLSEPAPSAHDTQELRRRTSQVRRQFRGRTSSSVARWLDSLERKLEAFRSIH